MNPSSDSFINVVQIDGLVLLKIIKHCRESLPDLVTGQLLGLDFYSTLEVTHSYPLPSRPVTDEDEQAEVEDSAAAEFQLDTMRLLRDVNVDTIPVGWYYSTYLGSFMTKSFVRDQFIFQEGIKKSVVLVFDPIKTNSGNLSLHAYRLTDRFMDKYRKEMSGDQFSLKDLSFEEIFEEVPIKIHNSNYVNVLLSELEEIPSMKYDFDRLDLSSNPFLEKNMEMLLYCIEDLSKQQQKFQFHQHQVARQTQQMNAYKQRRMAENATRRQQGLDALPEEDVSQLAQFKPIPPPNRLKSLLITNQISNYCQQMNQYSGQSLSKLFVMSSVAQPK
eukprot:TRINITY_DN6819_c0_g3_i2.p1 TRINITY_DN6819_c0_g3~~TRINITY_DN6819_c0_g3_i2.p1  ORF type:complete len:331 (+),score=92.64 TRINITY_DN6819_c0_g3_i2:68-1060(+)